MKISVISVNYKYPEWLQNGIDDFIKRFNNWQIKNIEIKPSTKLNAEQRILEEFKQIQIYIPKKSYIVVLDETGKDYATVDFATYLNDWHEKYNHICFIIGGADGTSILLKQQAQLVMRLSSMTFTHGFAKLILIEQLYRAWSILHKHPYHRI
jgi:23S rRNA (pseudouridine1915-N3)-methyltransferase